MTIKKITQHTWTLYKITCTKKKRLHKRLRAQKKWQPHDKAHTHKKNIVDYKQVNITTTISNI
jgi:hypothetical protein